jgi:diaminopimelate epimerase
MLSFAKLQGLGNDFIVFDSIKYTLPDYSELAKKACNRHFGIGADGILIIEESSKADIKMLIFNADGSQASMCGNGIRCFAKYVYENGYVNKNKFLVETLAGIIEIEVFKDKGKVRKVKANMGSPIFNSKLIPNKADGEEIFSKIIEIGGIKYKLYTIIVGCVHTVIFTDEIDNIDVNRIGPIIENHPIFPSKTNVNFCQVLDNDNIKVKTWEIGVGQTLACGTGATSAAVVSHYLYNTNKHLNVHLVGGMVNIDINENTVYMTGPAELICEGQYNW